MPACILYLPRGPPGQVCLEFPGRALSGGSPGTFQAGLTAVASRLGAAIACPGPSLPGRLHSLTLFFSLLSHLPEPL